MQIAIVLLIVIGTALILHGIFRAADGGGQQRQDPGHGVDVVWRVDSSRHDHRRDHHR